MRILFNKTLAIIVAIIVVAGLAIPHVCLDDDSAVAKVEQQVKAQKTAMDDHSGSKAADHCCIAHHCCFAKLINPAQTIWQSAFVSKADLFMTDQNHLDSLDPKNLDRPPKFFA